MARYPPGVWFADVISSFSGVPFVLHCLVSCSCFMFLLSLKPRRPFVQSFFDMHAAPIVARSHPTNYLCPSFCFVSFLFLWEMTLFPRAFCTIAVSSSYRVHVVRLSLLYGVFLNRDHGLDFDDSLCENSINQQPKIFPGQTYGSNVDVKTAHSFVIPGTVGIRRLEIQSRCRLMTCWSTCRPFL